MKTPYEEVIELGGEVVCNGCSEIEDGPYIPIIITLGTEEIRLYKLCKGCYEEAVKRLNSIFSAPLGDVVNIKYYDHTPDDCGLFKV